MAHPLGTETAVETVTQSILRLVLAGTFRPGERLPTEGLAERLGVSRTPVREALRQLAAEGIVEIVPRGGARLVSPSPEEVRDAYEIRAQLETLAVRKVATRMTPLVAARLSECLRREGEALESADPLFIYENTLLFHRRLAEEAASPLLRETLEGIFRRCFLYSLLLPLPDDENRKSAAEHRDILNALLAGNTDLAERLVRAHVLQQADEDAERLAAGLRQPEKR